MSQNQRKVTSANTISQLYTSNKDFYSIGLIKYLLTLLKTVKFHWSDQILCCTTKDLFAIQTYTTANSNFTRFDL